MNPQTTYVLDSMEPGEQYEHDLDVFKRRYGLRIVPKSESTFMKVLYAVSFMWIWNRTFMTRYTTTIGATIYTSKLGTSKSVADLALLRHEVQHIEDSRKFGSILWAFLYLFPQSLAPLALLSIWFGPWCLLALVALGPWPAPFRVWAELRGYARTFWTWQEFDLPWMAEEWSRRMRETFCGWSYYRMHWDWPRLSDRMWRMLYNEVPDAISE